MPATLPPYLTSGASSRAHHALLVKLHEASSSQEEREIINKEIARIKDVLATAGQNMAKVADSLIVLLHIHVMRTDTSDDLDFAMIHALQLAERGRTIQERRIGYLFIQERMREGDELSLMVINTIRKDLSSEDASRILMALQAIVKLPFRDISPAVTPILISRRLLKHASAAVRQRSMEAISALHIRPGASDFPLSISKVIRILSTEDDNGVLAVVLRLLKGLLALGIHRMASNEESLFLVEQVCIVVEERQDSTTQIGLEGLCILASIRAAPHDDASASRINQLVQRLLPNLDIQGTRGAAMMIGICQLVGRATSVERSLVSQIMRQMSYVLGLPAESSSNVAFVPRPNSHITILRCLTALPHASWDGLLGDGEMGVIMEGLNSPDNTIRRATLQLLSGISPELLDVSFDNLLAALRSSSDLCLPLHPPEAFEEKTTAGRLETSSRALEVAELQYCSTSPKENDEDLGKHFAASFVEILLALNEGVVNSTVVLSGSGASSSGGQVWEEGLRRVLALIESQTPDFQAGFAAEIVRHRIGSATLAVLRCTVVSQLTPSPGLAQQTLQVLLNDLVDFGPSVQELILLALIVVSSRPSSDADGLIQSIRKVQLESGKYIKKRAGQVVDLIQHDLVSEVVESAVSLSLPDILASMVKTHAAWQRSQKAHDPSTPKTPASPARSYKDVPSSLRYDAYDRPASPSVASIPRSIARHKEAGHPRPPGATLSPGGLALFDADDEDDGRPHIRSSGGQSSPGRAIPKARPAYLIMPEEDNQGLAPITVDEARTPTMRGRNQVQSMGQIP